MKNIDVKVCVGSRCTMMGAMNILDHVETIKNEYSEFDIQVETVKCLKECKESEKNIAPVVMINDEKIYNATSAKVMERMMEVMKE